MVSNCRISNENLCHKAESEDASTQYDIGVMYYNGQDVKQDYQTALEWYTKSAEQDIPLDHIKDPIY